MCRDLAGQPTAPSVHTNGFEYACAALGVVDDDVEDIHRYPNAGFSPFRLGEIPSFTETQYRVLHKLGQGSFSTLLYPDSNMLLPRSVWRMPIPSMSLRSSPGSQVCRILLQLFMAGTEWHAHCSRVERPRKPAERH